MLNDVTCGDCVDVMAHMPQQCVDFVLTDPPYLVNYRDRSGRRVANDDNDAWLRPAFRQIHRVLKPNCLALSFYGWDKADIFITAWRAAGFEIVGHVVFQKNYASRTRYLGYRHESAYLLAKGRPPLPVTPASDVLDFPYSGNRLHPTQKPVEPLKTLIGAFTDPGAVVLDAFCGSGSTLVAARQMGRRFIGIDLDPAHHHTARQRLAGMRNSIGIAA
jgi:DNA modification methylase